MSEKKYPRRWVAASPTYFEQVSKTAQPEIVRGKERSPMPYDDPVEKIAARLDASYTELFDHCLQKDASDLDEAYGKVIDAILCLPEGLERKFQTVNVDWRTLDNLRELAAEALSIRNHKGT